MQAACVAGTSTGEELRMASAPVVSASPVDGTALTGVVARHDWSMQEVRALHDLPLMGLVYRAQTVHRAVLGEARVQLCTLLSIKT